ncbi:MAG: tRNA lysidine(34) synthetase TilS [Deltaproteobacteria bacterium]|nr:tRNA lysidine(34) synthetase TilS [Deltaproteobacteria bacterium]
MQRKLAPFLRTVRQTLERHAMVQSGDHVLVALSGGADSVATLAALVRLAPRLGLTVSAAHVHHGLRGAEADRDAEMAAVVAARLGAPFRAVRLPAALARGGNLEERAREARYGALAAVAAEVGATKIATGHTRDDQAETVLMRIVRGCGPAGLAGILPLWRNGQVIRPLLECTRSEVEAFVAALQLPYCHDSSNQSRRFLRNRVRHELLPLLRQLNPRIDRALADLAALSRQASPPAAASPQEWLAVADLNALDPERRGQLVRHWLITLRGHQRGLTKQHVTAVLDLLGEGRPNRRAEIPGATVLREYTRLRYQAESAAELLPRPQELQPGQIVTASDWRIEASGVESWRPPGALPADLWSAVVDADAAPVPLLVRPAVAGDRVRPWGMAGRRKLSDIFVDRHVPRALRRICPVVQAGAEVVWVPGVVRGAIAAIGPQTRRIIRLRAQSRWQPLLG